MTEFNTAGNQIGYVGIKLGGKVGLQATLYMNIPQSVAVTLDKNAGKVIYKFNQGKVEVMRYVFGLMLVNAIEAYLQNDIISSAKCFAVPYPSGKNPTTLTV